MKIVPVWSNEKFKNNLPWRLSSPKVPIVPYIMSKFINGFATIFQTFKVEFLLKILNNLGELQVLVSHQLMDELPMSPYTIKCRIKTFKKLWVPRHRGVKRKYCILKHYYPYWLRSKNVKIALCNFGTHVKIWFL